METVIKVIVSMCLVSFVVVLTQMLRVWVHKQRHLFRQQIRGRMDHGTAGS